MFEKSTHRIMTINISIVLRHLICIDIYVSYKINKPNANIQN